MSRSMRAGMLATISMAGAAFASGAAAQGPVAPVGDAEAGAELYATECRGCHAVSIAPTLRGVIGRPIASVGAFTGYSDGLKARAADTWPTPISMPS